MATKLVFLFFLYIAAWKDHRTGEIDLSILSLSFLVTAAVGITQAISEKGLSAELIKSRALVTLIVLSLSLQLVYFKKLGGADVMIFLQIIMLFGWQALYKIMFLASISGIALVCTLQIKSGRRLSWDNVRECEIRFVPLIAFASQVVFLQDFF